MSDTPLARDTLDAIKCFGPPREPTYRDTLNEAAPELYNTLKKMRDYLAGCDNPPLRIVKLVEAALKKAEGRQY